MSDDNKSASKDFMNALHSAVAQELMGRIQSGEATTADIGAAIRFLKDNNIESAVVGHDGLTALMDSLPSFDNKDLYN